MNPELLRTGMLAAFTKAKFLRGVYLFLGLLIIVMPYLLDSWLTIQVSVFVLFLLRASQFFINQTGRGWISKGRRWHQQNLFFNGLNEKPSVSTIHEINLDFPDLKEAKTSYFASSKPAGPERLVENVSESAFYTSTYARTYKKLVLIPILILGGYIVYVLFTGQLPLEENTKKLIYAMTGFFFFGDIAARYLELNTIDTKCDEIYKEGLKLISDKNSPLTDSRAKEYAFKYFLTLNSTSPMPDTLHGFLNERTGKAWQSGIEHL